MVFQNYALYPHLSVADNMGFGLKLRREKKAEITRRVREAAELLGLDDLLDRKPRNLSGGQRQRVAMGRAIVREPQAFLMDEPLSNLDAKLRVQMRAEIARLQRDLQVTTIYVTHDQVEAMTMGDRVAVMKRGVLQQVDVPQVLYDQPVNVFVAGFIGSPSMNLVEARLDEDDGDLVVSFGPARLTVPDELRRTRPRLRDYVGRRVVLGIRPEEMADADGSDDGADRSIEITADLVEQMGSEAYVHFTMEAPRVLTEDTRDLVADALGDTHVSEIERTAAISPFVARVHPHTRIRKGTNARLVVDTTQMHFFDLDSGAAIWDDDRGTHELGTHESGAPDEATSVAEHAQRKETPV
jgi:multiple sugar transport system ATP-binding protein